MKAAKSWKNSFAAALKWYLRNCGNPQYQRLRARVKNLNEHLGLLQKARDCAVAQPTLKVAMGEQRGGGLLT